MAFIFEVSKACFAYKKGVVRFWDSPFVIETREGCRKPAQMFRFADDGNRIRMIVNGLQLRKTDDFRTTPFRLKRKRLLAETVVCSEKPNLFR